MSMIKRLGYIEIVLLQIILWAALWLMDEYLASLLTAIMVPIFAGILVISLIAELLDRSRVPRSFFVLLAISVCIPLFIGAFVYFAFGGVFDWLSS